MGIRLQGPEISLFLPVSGLSGADHEGLPPPAAEIPSAPRADLVHPEAVLHFRVDGILSGLRPPVKSSIKNNLVSTDRENVMGKGPVWDRGNVTPPPPQK